MKTQTRPPYVNTFMDMKPGIPVGQGPISFTSEHFQAIIQDAFMRGAGTFILMSSARQVASGRSSSKYSKPISDRMEAAGFKRRV
jgi:hypothetical protein